MLLIIYTYLFCLPPHFSLRRDAPDLILSHRVLDDVILKQNRIL